MSCIGKESLLDLDIENDAEIVKVGDQGVVVSLKPQSLLLRLASPKGMVLQKKPAVLTVVAFVYLFIIFKIDDINFFRSNFIG